MEIWIARPHFAGIEFYLFTYTLPPRLAVLPFGEFCSAAARKASLPFVLKALSEPLQGQALSVSLKPAIPSRCDESVCDYAHNSRI